MPLDCKLCGEWSLTKYICEDCNRIKDIVNLYSRDVVIGVLEKVLIRDEQQRIHKIENNKLQQKKVAEIKDKVKQSNNPVDNLHIK